MKKLILAIAITTSSTQVVAMTGAQINENVPNWVCNTEITFANGQERTYQLNTKNIMHNASRSGDMWMLKGKADSTGGKLYMYIYATNGKGTINYYTPDGEEFGKGTAQCYGKSNSTNP